MVEHWNHRKDGKGSLLGLERSPDEVANGRRRVGHPIRGLLANLSISKWPPTMPIGYDQTDTITAR